MSWIAPALTAPVEALLDELSAGYAQIDPHTVADPSLGTGTAGMALVSHALHGMFPKRGHDEQSHAFLEHAIVDSASGRRVPWLLEGLAGIAWVVERLGGREKETLLADLDARMLDALAALPRPWPTTHADGVAGMVVHALGRRSTPSGRTLLAAIAGGLEQVDPKRPDVDLGFAHGLPGTLAALAMLVDAGVDADALRPLLADAAHTLAAHRLPDGKDAFYPSAARRDRPARTAWCSGDPGVALALRRAGRALADASLDALATKLASHAAVRPVPATGVSTAWLCHGAAGLALLFGRHALPACQQASQRWVEAIVKNHASGPTLRFKGSDAKPAHAGSFLAGAGGVALTLLDGLGAAPAGWAAPLVYDA